LSHCLFFILFLPFVLCTSCSAARCVPALFVPLPLLYLFLPFVRFTSYSATWRVPFLFKRRGNAACGFTGEREGRAWI
jgi:hypothetical protein